MPQLDVAVSVAVDAIVSAGHRVARPFRRAHLFVVVVVVVPMQLVKVQPLLRGRENGLRGLSDSMEQISPSRAVRGFRRFAVDAVVFVRIAQPLLDGRHLRSVVEEEAVGEGARFLSHRKTLFRGAAKRRFTARIIWVSHGRGVRSQWLS